MIFNKLYQNYVVPFSLLTMAMSQEAPSPYICHFKIQSSVLPNQDSYQYHFDKLYVNAALPGGNGTPDILLSNLGSEFCYNGTQIIEDRSAFNQKIDFTTGLMFLEVPDDKSADWNRLIANGYATSTGKTEVDANGWSIGNDGSITYSSDKPRPWSRWSGWMSKCRERTIYKQIN
jgi:hypothetical protein